MYDYRFMKCEVKRSAHANWSRWKRQWNMSPAFHIRGHLVTTKHKNTLLRTKGSCRNHTWHPTSERITKKAELSKGATTCTQMLHSQCCFPAPRLLLFCSQLINESFHETCSQGPRNLFHVTFNGYRIMKRKNNLSPGVFLQLTDFDLFLSAA